MIQASLVCVCSAFGDLFNLSAASKADSRSVASKSSSFPRALSRGALRVLPQAVDGNAMQLKNDDILESGRKSRIVNLNRYEMPGLGRTCRCPVRPGNRFVILAGAH